MPYPIVISILGTVILGLIALIYRLIDREIVTLRDAKHSHANMIQEHEMRIGALERWRDEQ